MVKRNIDCLESGNIAMALLPPCPHWRKEMSSNQRREMRKEGVGSRGSGGRRGHAPRFMGTDAACVWSRKTQVLFQVTLREAEGCSRILGIRDLLHCRCEPAEALGGPWR